MHQVEDQKVSLTFEGALYLLLLDPWVPAPFRLDQLQVVVINHLQW